MSTPLVLPAQRQPSLDHVVHVYETEQALVRTVLQFLAPALADGGAALVVATPVHRDMLRDALADSGVALEPLTAAGRYVELDAEQVLAGFVSRDGRLDPDAFARTVGAQIRRQVAAHGRVHVFGEMVARLWGRGDTSTAIVLEDCWNALGRTVPFRLCCAYPATAVESVGTADDVAAMLAAHTAAGRV